MKLGSLFDGIGGFPLAASMHSIEPVWASEIETFPIEVTKMRFPNMKHLGDITQINGAEIEPVDIITFGSPCQRLSAAGRHDGFNITFTCEGTKNNPHDTYVKKIRATDKYQYLYTDTCSVCGTELTETNESALFFHAIRIIGEMRNATANKYPRYILWENVPGAFSSNGGQDFRTVLEEIAEAEIPMPKSGKWAPAGMVRGAGRSIAWRVLDARYFGVPQRRKRIFLVCDFAGQRAGEILFERSGLSGHFKKSREERQETTNGVGTGTKSTITFREIAGTLRANAGAPKHEADWEQLICEMHNDIKTDINDIPFVLQGSMIGRADKNGPQGDGINEGISFTLTATDRHAVVYGICSYASNSMKSGNPHSGIYEAKTSRTLDLNGGNPACNQGGIMIVNKDDGAQGQVVPEKHLFHCACGAWSIIYSLSDVCPECGRIDFGNVTYEGPHWDGETIPSRDISTLCELYENHGQDSRLTGPLDVAPTVHRKYGTGGNNTPLITGYPGPVNTLLSKANLSHRLDTDNIAVQNYTVRRLTVIECLRLQGFPDWWFDGVPGYSDTQGYKACGNSVAIPYVAWIMGQIALAKLSKDASQWTGSTAIKKRTNA